MCATVYLDTRTQTRTRTQAETHTDTHTPSHRHTLLARTPTSSQANVTAPVGNNTAAVTNVFAPDWLGVVSKEINVSAPVANASVAASATADDGGLFDHCHTGPLAYSLCKHRHLIASQVPWSVLGQHVEHF